MAKKTTPKKANFVVGDWLMCINHSPSPFHPKGISRVDGLNKGKIYRVYATGTDGEDQFVAVAELIPLDSAYLYSRRFRKLTATQLKRFIKPPRRKK